MADDETVQRLRTATMLLENENCWLKLKRIEAETKLQRLESTDLAKENIELRTKIAVLEDRLAGFRSAKQSLDEALEHLNDTKIVMEESL